MYGTIDSQNLVDKSIAVSWMDPIFQTAYTQLPGMPLRISTFDLVTAHQRISLNGLQSLGEIQRKGAVPFCCVFGTAPIA